MKCWYQTLHTHFKPVSVEQKGEEPCLWNSEQVNGHTVRTTEANRLGANSTGWKQKISQAKLKKRNGVSKGEL